MSVVVWGWVYVVSSLVFLQWFFNAIQLNSQANSLSFRLKGGVSHLRYRHGQRDLPPDEVLGAREIAARRHGF